MSSLKRLDNELWSCSDSSCLCRQLDQNNLTEITKGWLYGLLMLQELHLSQNAISRISSDAWEFCQKLSELWVAFCPRVWEQGPCAGACASSTGLWNVPNSFQGDSFFTCHLVIFLLWLLEANSAVSVMWHMGESTESYFQIESIYFL